jgi:hypothetical protein
MSFQFSVNLRIEIANKWMELHVFKMQGAALPAEPLWYAILWPGLILQFFKSCQKMHCINLYSTAAARCSLQYGLLHGAIRRSGSNELCPRRRQRQHSDDTTPAGITCKNSRCTFDILVPFFLLFDPSQTPLVRTVHQRAHRRGKCQHAMIICPLLDPFPGNTGPK